LIALAILAYFLLMKLLHLETIVELRFLNFLFAWRSPAFYATTEEGSNHAGLNIYHRLLWFSVSVLASAFFAFFIFIYLSYIDTSHAALYSVAQNRLENT